MLPSCGHLQRLPNKPERKQQNHRGGVLRRSVHKARHGGRHTFQQLGVDGHLEEAVEVLAVREAQEVRAVVARYWYRKRDGV